MVTQKWEKTSTIRASASRINNIFVNRTDRFMTRVKTMLEYECTNDFIDIVPSCDRGTQWLSC